MAFKVVYECPHGAIQYNDNQVLCEDYCSGNGCMFGREFCKIVADERWLGKEKELFEYISAIRADVLSEDELSDMREQMIGGITMEPRTAEKFVEALNDMNSIMKRDIKAGKTWRYTNVKKRNKTFNAARKKRNYLTNCATGVDWGLLIAGVPGSAQAWYGAPGKIAWVGANAKKEAKKYFDIIDIKGKKTVAQLYKAHELCAGDILTYKNLSHTNAYIGKKKSFDSGHAYCSGSGEMAPFKKWIGKLAHPNAKVQYILRLKDRIHYRIQSGAFNTETSLNAHLKDLEKKKIPYTLIEEGEFTKVQLGQFDDKENAEWYAAQYRDKDVSCIVKDM